MLVFLLALQLLVPIILILSGWGFQNLYTFLVNPARAGFAAVTLAAVVTAAACNLNIHPLRRGSRRVGSQSLQLGALLLLSFALLWFLPFADRRQILSPPRVLALCGSSSLLYRRECAPVSALCAGRIFQRICHVATEPSTGSAGHLQEHPPSALPELALGSNGFCPDICQLACSSNPASGIDIRS